MFLSMGDRDLGVAFHTHPGSQASSRGEAKDSTLFSSRDRYLLGPTEWPKMSQASCGVWREVSGLLSRPCIKDGPHLEMTGAFLGFSRAAAPVWVFLRGTTGSSRSLMLSMRRGSCVATQQLKNPTNCSFLTSDRARIAVALGSLETLDPNPSQSRPGF